jgi:hypothetical protein
MRKQKMRTLLFVSIGLMLTGCENRKVRFAGLNDLVVGVQQIVLYENGEFYLKLGAGGAEGKYEIVEDTVRLNYYDKPDNWPVKMLMTEEYFVTIGDEGQSAVKIKR